MLLGKRSGCGGECCWVSVQGVGGYVGYAGRGSGKTGRGRVLKLERGGGGSVSGEVINTFFPFFAPFQM